MTRPWPIIIPTAVLALAGCATTATPPDQVALQYSGGAVQAASFKSCVPVSTRDWGGIGDSYYSYPANQRNYVFENKDGSDAPAVTFVTKDGIEMTVGGVENFRLVTDCDTLRTFHELIGNRYQAYTPEGWAALLDIYIGQPLNTAIDRAGQGFTYQELYFDPAKKAEWEQAVTEQMPDLVNRQTDGDQQFFTDFAITLQKPDPPQAVKDALTQQQEAVAKANSAEAQADAQVAASQAEIAVQQAEAAAIAERIKVLGVDGYLKEEAIKQKINPFQPTGAQPIVQDQP